MTQKCMQAANIILDGIAHPEGRYADLMCDMAAALRACFGREPVQTEFLCERVRMYSASLMQDEMDDMDALEAGSDGARSAEIVRKAMFRVGTLLAIFAATGEELPEAHVANLIRLIRNLNVMAPETLAKLIGEFESMTITRANEHVCTLMAMIGMSVKTTSVEEYGHPIDAGIVNALDTPVINAIFKRLVDFFSDTQQGQMMASAIPVTPGNFSDLNGIVNDCVRLTGIKRPDVVVTSSIPGLNAMTFGSEDKPCIAISSLMLRCMSPEQLRFVIGHECGHIAMGHVVYHVAAKVLSSYSEKIPVIGKLAYDLIALPLSAWSRRSEITADRAGLICCRDVETAKQTLLQLQAGLLDAKDINLEEYLSWSHKYRSGSILRRSGELTAQHPMLPKRIEALDMFAGSVGYYQATDDVIPANALPREALNRRVEEILKVL